jgi:catechol 2,3-dioxygenase-like lactoylglutathione lyase family enzyme
MPITGVDHINIAGPAELIERCRAFYVDVLQLADGHRPAFRSRGYWLYAADRPIVHLTVREDERSASPTHLDHCAFACIDLDATIASLERHGVPYAIDRVPSGAAQLFLHDPAGVGIELNFA